MADLIRDDHMIEIELGELENLSVTEHDVMGVNHAEWLATLWDEKGLIAYVDDVSIVLYFPLKETP